jgi:hypothetical protein
MPIMDYKTWMSETKRGILTPRSAELVAIDKALQRYDAGKTFDNLEALKNALDVWIRSKGAGWRTSTRNKNGTVERLLQQVTEALGPAVITKHGYELENMPRTLDQQIVVNAMDTIKTAVSRAQWAASMAARDTRESKRLETWFGAGVKSAEVRSIYDKIFHGIAHGAHIIRDTDPGEADTYAYVKLSDLRPPPRIYLCGAFWKGGRITWARQGGGWSKKDNLKCNDNPLGVVIHELTHLFAATQDHVYGRDGCKRLAISNAVLARRNADSYEYYCEDVFLGLY